MTNKKKISDAEFIKVAKGEGGDVIETVEKKHVEVSKGKHSFNTGVGNTSQVVSEERKSPAQIIAEVELEEKQAEKDGKTISIVRGEFGKVKFEIEETKNDLGLTEGDVKFLKENPELMREILSILAEKDTKTKIKETDLQESIDIQDIFESNVFEEATILENQNLIKNITLIKKISKNNRIYKSEALENIVTLADGIKVFCDHVGRDSNGKARSVRDLIGRILNPKKTDGVVKGDFEVLKNYKDWIFAIANQMPEVCGMSIRARGMINAERDEQGREVVDNVKELISIDLVTNPATTSGIFEDEKKFKEDEDPCPYYRTKDCIVTSFGDDADKCKFTNRNCPFK